MILCDTSAMIALINQRDSHHERCKLALKGLRSRLITTWACVTEAMYLLGEVDKERGVQAQEVLRGYLEDRRILLHIGSEEEANRIYALMRKYKKMDFADGSLVAAAESLNIRRIFTLDSDFYFYIINDKSPFEVLPNTP